MRNEHFNKVISQVRIAILIAVLATFSGCLDQSSTSTTATPLVGFGATSAVNLNGTQIQLTWPALPAKYVQVNILQLQPNGSFATIYTGPSGMVSYVVNGLSPGNLFSFEVQAVDTNGASDGNSKLVSAFTYAGITNASSIGPTYATINFPVAGANASGVNIYCKTAYTQDALLASGVSSAVGNFKLTGLLSGTNYVCHAQAVALTTGVMDQNSFTAGFQTITLSSQAGPTGGYQGPILVQAFGDVSTGYAPSGPTQRQVSITWKPFPNAPNGITTAYKLVRVVKGGSFSMNTTQLCTSATSAACQVCIGGLTGVTAGVGSTTSSSITCTDTQIAASPTKYEYAVTLVVNSNPLVAEELPATGDASFRILVPIPPTNMVLVHRDSVNYEICNNYLLLSNSVSVADPLNHQRCPYSGGVGAIPVSSQVSGIALPASNNVQSGYYDFGYDLFLDRWPTGCNWTPGTCGSGTDGFGFSNGTGGNCFGSTGITASNIQTNDAYRYGSMPNPPSATVGQVGNVFYSSDLNVCWLKTGPAQWVSNFSQGQTQAGYFTSLSSANFVSMSTNAPAPPAVQKIPPLLGSPYFTQQLCGGQTVVGYGNKRMMRKREYVAAAAFQVMPGEPAQITNQTYLRQLFTYWNGVSPINPQSIQGCAYNQYIIPVTPFNSNENSNDGSIGNQSDARMFFVLGSTATANCVSRFGAQDLIGNGSEWLSDQMVCNPTTHVCTGQVSNMDAGNKDLAGFQFNGSQGPGGTQPANGLGIQDIPYGWNVPLDSRRGRDSWPGFHYAYGRGQYTDGSNHQQPTIYGASWGNVPTFGNAQYLNVPLGLPMVSSDGGGAVPFALLQQSVSQVGIASRIDTDFFNAAGVGTNTSFQQFATVPNVIQSYQYDASNVGVGQYWSLGPGRFNFDASFAPYTDNSGNHSTGERTEPAYGTTGAGLSRCVLPAE